MDSQLCNTSLLARGLGVVALLILASCTSSHTSDVVSFHEGNLPRGETIRVEPADPAKEGSLEFRSYARLIGDQLTRLGYSYQEDRGAPVTLVAEVDYSVEVGPTDVRVDQPLSPFVRYHFYYGRAFDPFYMGYDNGWRPDVSSTPTYLRNLTMNIVENTDERKRLFEGRVQSRGIQNELPEVMPYLVTAMFTNFPGESGVTKVVTVEEQR